MQSFFDSLASQSSKAFSFALDKSDAAPNGMSESAKNPSGANFLLLKRSYEIKI